MEYPNPGVRTVSFGVQGRFSGFLAVEIANPTPKEKSQGSQHAPLVT